MTAPSTTLRPAEPGVAAHRASHRPRCGGSLLLVQILNLHHDPAAQLALAVVAVPVLLVPRIRHSPWVWIALAAPGRAAHLVDFVELDDHVVRLDLRLPPRRRRLLRATASG